MLPAVVAVLVASPVVVALVAVLGEPWYPAGDWASLLYRTSRVGTADTPLVGVYSTKGYAHPGPFPYLVSAPFLRLWGGDARALELVAGLLAVASLAAVVVVARRRGRTPFLLATGLVLALLVQGLDPGRLVDPWNPYLGLLPFLLALLLAWDAGMGRRWSLAWAALPATAAIQAHISFIALTVLVAAWLAAWVRWSDRLVPPAADADAARPAADPADAGQPSWGRVVRVGVLATLPLWLLPLVDLAFGTHNLATIVGNIVSGSGTQIGLTHGGSLVSRYVRPDGPWLGGAEPEQYLAVQGSGPVPVVLVLALLAGALLVARRRGLRDAAALLSLAIVLVVGAVPAAASLVAPAFSYLVQFLKVVGAVVWLALGWTAWRLAEPAVRRAGRTAVRVAGAVASVALVAVVAWDGAAATAVEHPIAADAEIVQDLRPRLRDALDDEPRYLVGSTGDSVANFAPGVIHWMIEDGFDVVTRDGWAGLKWGHEHLWERGDPYDEVLTVAVRYPSSWVDPIGLCAADPDVELVAAYEGLTDVERLELALLQQRQGSLEGADRDRLGELASRGIQVAVFAGDALCGQDLDRQVEDLREAFAD